MKSNTFEKWFRDFKLQGAMKSSYYNEAVQYIAKEVFSLPKPRILETQDYKSITPTCGLLIETELPTTVFYASMPNGTEVIFQNFDVFNAYWKNKSLFYKGMMASFTEDYLKCLLGLRTITCEKRMLKLGNASKTFGSKNLVDKYHLLNKTLAPMKPVIVREGFVEGKGAFIEIISY